MTQSPLKASRQQSNSDAAPSFISNMIAGCGLIGVVVTIVSMMATQHWVADLFAQFKLHWAFGLFVVLIGLAILKRWRMFLVCFVALVINAIPIWPYMVGPLVRVSGIESQASSDDSLQEARFRIISLNVLTRNGRYQSVIDLLRAEQADFVILMEIDAAWKKALEPLNDVYEFTRFETREDNFGIAFLSKHAWSSIEVFPSQTLQLPSIDVRFDAADGLASFDLPKPLRIIGTHPIPPLSQGNTRARDEQLQNVAGRFDSSSFNVMAGDFNLAPWSPVFADILSTGDLQDASVAFGVAPTWYVFPTWLGALKIDHVLHGPDVLATGHRVGMDVGSDHRAVVVDFRLK